MEHVRRGLTDRYPDLVHAQDLGVDLVVLCHERLSGGHGKARIQDGELETVFAGHPLQEIALDGLPRFDLNRPNRYLISRLRDRVSQAGRRGFYVSVMFFQGFSLDKTGATLAGRKGSNAFLGHPMHRENNVNGIDGDPGGSGTGHQVHTLDVPAITRLQEQHVARVIDELGDLDNILWEVTNESHLGSVDWQYHIIDFVHDYERDRPKRHPIGMSGAPIGTATLLASNADWIAPFRDGRPGGAAPPPMDGAKVVIADTDHIGALISTPSWVWRCMLNGHSFSIMDPYVDARYGSPRAPHTEWEELRRQAGFSLRVAGKCDLNHMVPKPELSSSSYCLANPGVEYLVYLDQGDDVEIDLSAATGELSCAWFDVETGEFEDAEALSGGRKQRLVPSAATRQLAHIRAR